MENVAKDLRYAVRSLAKRPAFTAVAVLSLALGIGANTTVFSLVKALFLKPIPVHEPERLVSLVTTDEKNPERTLPSSYPNLRDLRDQNDTLTGIGGYTFTVVDFDADGKVTRLVAIATGGDYFDVLGVDAWRGRTLKPSDTPAPEQGEEVVVLGHGFWERHFGADENVVGSTVKLNRLPFTVAGIMPPGFKGGQTQVEIDLWFPVTLLQRVSPGWEPDGEAFSNRRFAAYQAVARLKPGVARQQAEADLQRIGKVLEKEFPVENKGRNFRLIDLAEANIAPMPEARARLRLAMGLLMGLVGLVLLIACANVANLLLVQAQARSREVALRLSLGSSQWQLARRFIVESLLLAVGGGLLSAVLAPLGRNLLVSSFPAGLMRIGYDLSFDGWMFGFTASVTLLTAAVFGAIPAWKAARTDVVQELKDVPALGGSGRRFSAGNLLVGGQVALSLVALVATGLFVRSLNAIESVDPGFDAEKLAAVSYDLGVVGYDVERAVVFNQELTAKVAALPGVESAAVSDFMPFRGGGFGRTVFREGEDEGSGQGGRFVYCAAVSPGFLGTLGVEILKGRGIEATDLADSQKVVLVTEAMADEFWPGEDPLGKRFHFHGVEEYRYVVGVVRTPRFFALNEDPMSAAYYPLTQMPVRRFHFAVRTDGAPAEILDEVRAVFQELDPNVALQRPQALSENVDQSLFLPRTISRLLGVFGALALVLALIGLFGVVSYSVAQRHREIGIRMAIGARRGEVVGLVLRQGLALVAGGLVVGMLAAWGGGRLLEGFLFGVSPTDLLTLVATPLFLLVVAVLAILLPARRAASIDPVAALKYE